MRLRPEAVVAALSMLISSLVWLSLSGLLSAMALGLGGALVIALWAWLRRPRAVAERDGVRFSHRLVLEKDVPFEAIADTRVEARLGGSRLVLLGEGGVRLGAIQEPRTIDVVLRALGPRRAPEALAELARPHGATVSEWRTRLDARAHRLSDASYRASPDADIDVLASTIADESCALDVRAGAAYVLVQSGIERAIDRARIALKTAPPLAIAMARAAEGGRALVTKERAREALRVVADSDAELLDRPDDEEPEQHERDHHR